MKYKCITENKIEKLRYSTVCKNSLYTFMDRRGSKFPPKFNLFKIKKKIYLIYENNDKHGVSTRNSHQYFASSF